MMAAEYLWVLANGKDEAQQAIGWVLGVIAWVATAAGVMGVLIVGARMALALRTGEGEENMVQLATVLGACIIAATAAPIVNFIL